MWRALARRALLGRRTATQRLSPPILHLHQEAVTLLSAESVSRLSLLSAKSHIFHSPRFFSSNYEESSFEFPITGGNEIDGDFSDKRPDLEQGDSIFDIPWENFKMNDVDVDRSNPVGEMKSGKRPDLDQGDSFFDVPRENFKMNDVDFDRSDPMGEILKSGVMEDGDLGLEKTNDPGKVESLLSLLQSRGTVDGSLESDFEGMDLVLDEEFVLKVLQTPSIPGENLISFFKWVMKKSGFILAAPVLDALVSAICQENRKLQVYALWDLIKEMGEKMKGVVNTNILNEMIAEFLRLGKAKACFEVFNKFEELGCPLDANSYYLTFKSLSKRSFYDWACLVCEKMLNADELPDVEKIGEIISCLCRGGRAKDAHLVYLCAKDKNVNLPQPTITFLIRALARIEKGAKKEMILEEDKETASLALEMLSEYSSGDRKHAIKPFTSVIKKLCWIEDVDRAKKLLYEMVESGPPPGNEVFNCVISGLAKTADMEEALNMKNLMQKRGLKLDVFTYSVIISGYSRGGEMEEACKIFDEAKSQHSQLSPVTFHSLIRGFCKLEQYDKAVSLLGEMKHCGLKPTHDEYNKLIKSLCLKASDWETAEKVLEQMKENGVILNGRTRALINAVKELDLETSAEVS